MNFSLLGMSCKHIGQGKQPIIPTLITQGAQCKQDGKFFFVLTRRELNLARDALPSGPRKGPRIQAILSFDPPRLGLRRAQALMLAPIL